ncbi:MAG TPA: aminotransferase class V-fold PLP-dependent enzyme [Acetobacteraceae bacterium]|nr:aminotransferase class V-fold PLP-dependent enzyme [Acetobacteraceae bacterium]
MYLDANATEPLRPDARAAMLEAADLGGNPASVHAAGRAARRVLEDAREALGRRFGARPSDIVFTSGATEAACHAIATLGRNRRIIVGATEHDAVRAAAPGAAILPVDRAGRADLDALARLLVGPPALVCLMAANNETGVLHDIAAASLLCHENGALLFVDAAQAAGRIAIDFAESGAHAMALSSHKLGGPPGAGALLLASQCATVAPLIAGGGQERGRRGGTPALPAIAGFAAAAERPSPAARLAGWRDRAERQAVAAGAVVIGAEATRLPNTTCIALLGIPAEIQVIALDLAGIAVSAGAACSSGKVARSHVLDAMGLGPAADAAIRVSLPWNAQESDIAAFADAYGAMASRLRARRAA